MNITELQFQKAQAGDPLALDALLRSAQPDIKRYARKQCYQGTAIEDVVQEALIILYKNVKTLRDQAGLSAWIFRVVGRLCMLPALGLMRGIELLQNDEHIEQYAAKSIDELRLDLVKALESLPLIYREIILLRDIEQLTITEIANYLELTREAVKSRIHRARAMTREYLIGTHSNDSKTNTNKESA